VGELETMSASERGGKSALPSPDGELRHVVVSAVQEEADDVRSLLLVDPGGAPLPPWTAGAHIDTVLPSGLVRQYSLCGDRADRNTYRIAVLRDEAGRGGSRELHETASVGATLRIRGPRNHFEFRDAPRYLFLAGGIGITPIHAMVHEAVRRGVPFELYYGGRTRRSMAFAEELSLVSSGAVHLVPQDEQGILDLDAIVARTPEGAAVYCCGPEPMLTAAEGACARLNRAAALHLERFAAGPRPAEAAPAIPGETFVVVLRRSGRELTVPPERSLLDVVREVVPDILFACEEGFCGSCETRVLEGQPEHHDSLLSDDERERSDTMMICVGRSRSSRLVLDL
jgi:ferredoxin-NADP reductase